MSIGSKKNIRANGYSRCDGNSGYGKPLVTPVNKRLTLRRDLPWPQLSADGVPDPHIRCTPSIGNHTKSPTRAWKATKASVSGNKLRASNTNPNVYPDTKIPIMRSNIGAKSLRPSVSSLHRSNSRSPARKQKSFNSTSSNFQEPMRRATSIKDVNPSVDKMKSLSREPYGVPPLTRPAREEKIDRPSVNKFDDELRRQQLLEIKKKFQSKRFWNDSKYDKIEGLNWISWK
ncbi:uncharacterized protein LOC124633542 [Helicoverpa zea]|uniref:uncharacterized protein LOC124633542 n=1 Tax=Helicoverpa zea TaxID=7113 RepID=UPI001F57D984|nr:uncharacterized protein LOC124633542 [Helicoverpa zea]